MPTFRLPDRRPVRPRSPRNFRVGASEDTAAGSLVGGLASSGLGRAVEDFAEAVTAPDELGGERVPIEATAEGTRISAFAAALKEASSPQSLTQGISEDEFLFRNPDELAATMAQNYADSTKRLADNLQIDTGLGERNAMLAMEASAESARLGTQRAIQVGVTNATNSFIDRMVPETTVGADSLQGALDLTETMVRETLRGKEGSFIEPLDDVLDRTREAARTSYLDQRLLSTGTTVQVAREFGSGDISPPMTPEEFSKIRVAMDSHSQSLLGAASEILESDEKLDDKVIAIGSIANFFANSEETRRFGSPSVNMQIGASLSSAFTKATDLQDARDNAEKYRSGQIIAFGKQDLQAKKSAEYDLRKEVIPILSNPNATTEQKAAALHGFLAIYKDPTHETLKSYANSLSLPEAHATVNLLKRATLTDTQAPQAGSFQVINNINTLFEDRLADIARYDSLVAYSSPEEASAQVAKQSDKSVSTTGVLQALDDGAKEHREILRGKIQSSYAEWFRFEGVKDVPENMLSDTWELARTIAATDTRNLSASEIMDQAVNETRKLWRWSKFNSDRITRNAPELAYDDPDDQWLSGDLQAMLIETTGKEPSDPEIDPSRWDAIAVEHPKHGVIYSLMDKQTGQFLQATKKPGEEGARQAAGDPSLIREGDQVFWKPDYQSSPRRVSERGKAVIPGFAMDTRTNQGMREALELIESVEAGGGTFEELQRARQEVLKLNSRERTRAGDDLESDLFSFSVTLGAWGMTFASHITDFIKDAPEMAAIGAIPDEAERAKALREFRENQSSGVAGAVEMEGARSAVIDSVLRERDRTGKGIIELIWENRPWFMHPRETFEAQDDDYSRAITGRPTRLQEMNQEYDALQAQLDAQLRAGESTMETVEQMWILQDNMEEERGRERPRGGG